MEALQRKILKNHSLTISHQAPKGLSCPQFQKIIFISTRFGIKSSGCKIQDLCEEWSVSTSSRTKWTKFWSSERKEPYWQSGICWNSVWKMPVIKFSCVVITCKCTWMSINLFCMFITTWTESNFHFLESSFPSKTSHKTFIWPPANCLQCLQVCPALQALEQWKFRSFRKQN